MTWRDDATNKVLGGAQKKDLGHSDWMNTGPRKTVQSKWYWNGALKNEWNSPVGEGVEKYSKHRKQHVVNFLNGNEAY